MYVKDACTKFIPLSSFKSYTVLVSTSGHLLQRLEYNLIPRPSVSQLIKDLGDEDSYCIHVRFTLRLPVHN